MPRELHLRSSFSICVHLRSRCSLAVAVCATPAPEHRCIIERMSATQEQQASVPHIADFGAGTNGSASPNGANGAAHAVAPSAAASPLAHVGTDLDVPTAI